MTLRVCLTGVESTGKSRLAPRLAAKFGGITMPEYGREWAETNGLDFTTAALREIAATHVARRMALEAAAPRLIVEDTDVVMTSAWQFMLYGSRDALLSAMPADADLYLLMSPDTPWIEDGTRQFSGTDRLRFASAVSEELQQRGIRAVTIGGDWRARFMAAQAAIQLLGLEPV
ncbi:ATP-binding protein [Sandarakinorhabdus sp.]|uniref:ATP-binding protein n=1 Tax=Sandarakinorhabdus sp. TaxID=1916663 RepID=UPI00286DA2A9|nr:ATP-binding protein [Sandarakinorhabdus sp.]